MFKHFLDRLIDKVEVNQNIGFVFRLGKRLYDIAFPNTPCALHQESTFTVPLFPLQQFLIDFSAHKEPPDKTAKTSYLYKRITQIKNLCKEEIAQIKIFIFHISTQIE